MQSLKLTENLLRIYSKQILCFKSHWLEKNGNKRSSILPSGVFSGWPRIVGIPLWPARLCAAPPSSILSSPQTAWTKDNWQGLQSKIRQLERPRQPKYDPYSQVVCTWCRVRREKWLETTRQYLWWATWQYTKRTRTREGCDLDNMRWSRLDMADVSDYTKVGTFFLALFGNFLLHILTSFYISFKKRNILFLYVVNLGLFSFNYFVQSEICESTEVPETSDDCYAIYQLKNYGDW